MKHPSKTRQNNPRESGVALVSVLSILALSMLVVAAIVAASQTLRYRTVTQVGLSESTYHGESAANLAIWLLLSDRASHTDRNLDGGNQSITTSERYRADGRLHQTSTGGKKYHFMISDLYSGITMAGAAPGTGLNFLNETLALLPDRREKLAIFRDRLQDYTDADDNVRLHGMERFDYFEVGLAPLPRNGPLQYREEVLWIPGSEEFINTDEDGTLRYVNIVLPRGVPQSSRSSNLFGTPLSLIRDKVNLDDHETSQVETALKRVREEGLKLEEAFQHREPLLLKLRRSFSTVESGFYTITVTPGDDSGGGRKLQLSLRLDSVLPNHGIIFLQWQLL